MSTAFSLGRKPWSLRTSDLPLTRSLGIVFGVVMPVVAALLFPTYVNTMPLVWQERARLLELPFVFCEMLIIGVAMARGMTLQAMWRGLSQDVRAAVAVLLTAMFVSSVLMATHRADAVLQSMIQIVHLHFGLAIFHLARDQRGPDWNALYGPLIAGVVVIALYSAWRLGFPPPLSQVRGGVIQWDFSLPGFISIRYLGTWLGAIAAALSVKLLYLDRHDRLTIDHAVFVFVLGFMFWTGTRAAVLGVLLAIALTAMTVKALPAFRALSVGAALALLALALSILFEFGDPIFRLHNPGEAADLATASAGRTELWRATLVRWWESPLTGWGAGSIFFDVKVGWTHTQPHNVVLQFLVSWGIFGAAAALWLIARALRVAVVAAAGDRQSWPILAMVYSLLAMSMVDGALYYPRFIIMFVVGLALLAAARARPLTS